MWNVSIAAIPGPWPALAVAPWLAGTVAAALLMGLAFVLAAAARRPRGGERRSDARVRRLHGERAA